jgi:hypothetical protein
VTAKPYDPTLKALVEIEPESWPALLGRPAGPTMVTWGRGAGSLRAIFTT